MKRLLFLILLFAVPCAAQTSVSLSWDASATPGVSYNLYRTKTTGGCAVVGPACVKINTAAISVLTYADSVTGSGRWFYTVRAIDADGIESANSNELAVILPPSAPANLRKN